MNNFQLFLKNFILALSTENSPMKTWSGMRATSHSKQNRTGTRARHLSDYVQVEDLRNKNHVRSASMSASKFHTRLLKFIIIPYLLD